MPLRSQSQMKRALDQVAEVESKWPAPGDTGRKVYGGLCHQFPIWVHTNGLCQAVAFVASKAGEKSEPHLMFLRHVQVALEVPAGDDFATTIAKWPLPEYMMATRRYLQGANYSKRFAVSILKVVPGADRDAATEPPEAGA